MGWPDKPMESLGEDHDEGCRAPGAPHACHIVPHPVFQEGLYHDLVVNVPYNPMKDFYSINLPIDDRKSKLTLWGRTFWICPKTEAEAAAALARRIRSPRKRPRWWRRLLFGVIRRITR